jgi:hypothetical protein
MRLLKLLGLLLSGLVVVTFLTAVGAFGTFLPYLSVHRKFTLSSLAAIIVIATISMIIQASNIVKSHKGYGEIGQLLSEGRRLAQQVEDRRGDRSRDDYPSRGVRDIEDYNLLADWCRRVEDALRRHLNETYVDRFHFGGSLQQDERSMTLWKTWHRLETLGSFLTDLRP